MNSIDTIVNLTGKKERVHIVPDFPRYVRDVTRYGVVGATMRKMLHLPLHTQVQLIIGNIPHAAELLRKDFVRGVLFLIEMELYQEANTANCGIVLTNQLADLAGCFGNGHLFEEFYRLAQRYHLKSGIVTYNAGITIPLITKINIPFDYFVVDTNRTDTIRSIRRFGKTAIFRFSRDIR
jgi:hypothetical protein